MDTSVPDDGGDGERDARGEVGGGPCHRRRRKLQPQEVEVLPRRAAMPNRSTIDIYQQKGIELAQIRFKETVSFFVCARVYVAREATKRRAKARAPTAMGRSVPLVAREARRSVAAAMPWR